MRQSSPRRWYVGSLLAGVLVLAVAGAGLAAGAPTADESLGVDFAVTKGTPTYRASGWIYGMTEDGKNAPDKYFRDVKFRAMRAGGAQLPGSGWVGGGYDRRWNATRAQAQRTAALGGTFVMLNHDLWGADGGNIGRFPGDNGDWTEYDKYLDRLFSDVKAAGLTVEWDIWNEPNIDIFWKRPPAQYFEMWAHTYRRVRATFPTMAIVGPSCACVPGTGGWWTQFLDYVKASNTVPDIVSWHALPSDPVGNVATADQTLDSRGIAHRRPYQINEYGAPEEQNPGDGAWYIARLERAGADGLRANWAGGPNLHDDLANLLTRDPGGQYHPKGEWWVYNFYASQTGRIASVTPSGSYDAFATKADGSAKILVGGGGRTGNVAVNLRGLDSTTGIVQNNQVRVVVQNIPYNNGGAVTGPVTVSDSVVPVTGNSASVTLAHNDINATATVTLLPPQGGSGGQPSASPSSAQPAASTPPAPSPSSVQPAPSPTSAPPTSPSTPPSSPSTSAAGTPGTPGDGSGAGSTGCRSVVHLQTWPGGYLGTVTVLNQGPALTPWSVTFAVSPGTRVFSGWNATVNPVGSTVTANAPDWNRSLATGREVTIGFVAAGSAERPPGSVRLNGRSCRADGGAAAATASR